MNTNLGPIGPSCEIHDVAPSTSLRDLLCLLPARPVHRVLELAPASWSKTAAKEGVHRALGGDGFRQATDGLFDPHRTTP